MTPAQLNMLIHQSMITDEPKNHGLNTADEVVLWLKDSGYLNQDLNPTLQGWNELKSHSYKGYERLRLECGEHVSIRPPLCAQTTPLEQEVEDLFKRVEALEGLAGMTQEIQEPEPKKEIEPGFYRYKPKDNPKDIQIIQVYKGTDKLKYQYLTGSCRDTFDIIMKYSIFDVDADITPIKWVDA